MRRLGLALALLTALALLPGGAWAFNGRGFHGGFHGGGFHGGFRGGGGFRNHRVIFQGSAVHNHRVFFPQRPFFHHAHFFRPFVGSVFVATPFIIAAAPSPVWVPGSWQWTGWQWVWVPGWWASSGW